MITGKKLTEAPGSLKEAVDWVLCMSGNDDGSHYGKGVEAIQALAQRVKSLLGAVRVGSVDVNTLFKGGLNKQSNHNASILSLCLELKALIDETNGMGKNYIYAYYYHDLSNAVDNQIANIFLGAIPLLLFGLGFLF